MSDNRVQKLIRDHGIAERIGRREGKKRAYDKTHMYVRVFRLAETVGVAPTVDACTCGVVSEPHLHQFGSVIPVTTHRTCREVADSVVACHNWHDKGTKKVFKGRTHDHKSRKDIRKRKCVQAHTRAADALHRARKILENPKSLERSKKRAAQKLGVKLEKRKTLEIWEKALARRAK